MSRAAADSGAPPGEEHSLRPGEHLVGRWGDSSSGPLLLCFGGLHGNEPAGVEAIHRVLERLAGRGVRLAGEMVGVQGNCRALRRDLRFLDLDLNRLWTPGRIRAWLEGRPPRGAAEDAEQGELVALIQQELQRAERPVFFLDLHTSSAEGPPFATIGDTLRNRHFARSFPLPVLLGLEELVEGSLLEYLNNCGAVTLGVEGGQHRDPASADRLEAAVWLALEAAGLMDPTAAPWLPEMRERLARASRGIPRLLDVRYRHPIPPGSRFRMRPGYRSFDPIRRGEILADQDGREVRSPMKGRILLPLYQQQGNDGFFLVREIRPFWLAVSAFLRHLRLGAVVHWLPGVRRDPADPDRIEIDLRVARWYSAEIFHLLGYRFRLRLRHRRIMSRRRYDLRGPRRVDLRLGFLPGDRETTD